MDFLEKLNLLMRENKLNKNSLSKSSEIPYTTIDGWYKKGYESMQLTTLKKLSNFFETSLDFWANDDIDDPTYGKANGFKVEFTEMQLVKKYRLLDTYGKEAVDDILDIEYRRCYDANEYITEVAARGNSEKKVKISKEAIRKDLENYTPPEEL